MAVSVRLAATDQLYQGRGGLTLPNIVFDVSFQRSKLTRRKLENGLRLVLVAGFQDR